MTERKPYREPAGNCARRNRLRPALPLALALASLLLAPLAPAQTVEDLRITVGKSLVIDYPTDIGRISISNPEVLDAVPATSREFLLHGKAHGAATVVVWSKAGQRSMYNVSVEHNLEPIRRLLRETFPGEEIHVQAARDSVTLTGRVTSKEISDRALALATPLAKTVLNNLYLPSTPVDRQVVLRVKFAEVNRNIGNSFGVNLVSTGAANTPGSVTTGQFQAPTPSTLRGVIPGRAQGTTSDFSISDALNIFAFRPDLNLAAFIRALQSEGVLQILAEPNLVTTVGKEASFLVGGEFPVPILQGGANAGAVTVQFREFGIRLTFNPQITANNTIKMFVKPEVSTIDLANAVTLSGFLIPALATRRMETNIELGEGQSFVIGGLIDDRVTETMSRIPGLSNIPVLGALFRSRDTRKSKTELVVIVTPEIAVPLNPGDPRPVPVMPREALAPTIPPPAKISLNLPPKGVRAARNGKSKEAPAPPPAAAEPVSPALIERAAPAAAAPAAAAPAPAPAAPEAVAAPESAPKTAEPAEPQKPLEPVKPAEPAEPAKPAEPVAEPGTKPVEPPKPEAEAPAKPVEPQKPESAEPPQPSAPQKSETEAPAKPESVPPAEPLETREAPDSGERKESKEKDPKESKETRTVVAPAQN